MDPAGFENLIVRSDRSVNRSNDLSERTIDFGPALKPLDRRRRGPKRPPSGADQQVFSTDCAVHKVIVRSVAYIGAERTIEIRG